MLKRTLYFSSPGKLLIKNTLLLYQAAESGDEHTFSMEDIGVIVIESQQIQITAYALAALGEKNVAVVICNRNHLPSVQMIPFSANALTASVFSAQLNASEALRGRLWKQTVQAKLRNQALCLKRLNLEYRKVEALSKKVKNGDPVNCEAVAARFYFHQLGMGEDFTRDRFGFAPNNALNYGYIVLRAAMARAIVGSGMLCISGIHHCNQYNAFALADDIMEPYRPFIDDVIFSERNFFNQEELNHEQKAKLLQALAMDVNINGDRRPLLNAMSHTTASLVRCFLKEEKEILYPEFADVC